MTSTLSLLMVLMLAGCSEAVPCKQVEQPKTTFSHVACVPINYGAGCPVLEQFQYTVIATVQVPPGYMMTQNEYGNFRVIPSDVASYLLGGRP